MSVPFIFEQNEITKFYVWEILHGTVSKMEKHVAKLVKELDEAKEMRYIWVVSVLIQTENGSVPRAYGYYY